MPQCSAVQKVSGTDFVSQIIVLPTTVVAALTNGAVASLPPNLTGCAELAPPGPSGAACAGLVQFPGQPYSVLTCDGSGRVCALDARVPAQQQPAPTLLNKRVTTISASNFGEVAFGTEADPDAEVLVYDIRAMGSPVRAYADTHNDDVTDLEFHPTIRHQMLSGSTDGVVNLYDLNISSDEDAVVQAFNHQASIHRCGYLPQMENRDWVFALSHMETLSIYPVLSEEELNDLEGRVVGVEDFGDLRTAWKCQYVADYRKEHFLLGSNDEQWGRLVHMTRGVPRSVVELEGGHGEEVIRCFDFDAGGATCYTGGEDGCVRVWDVKAKAEASFLKHGKTRKVLHRADPLAGRRGKKN